MTDPKHLKADLLLLLVTLLAAGGWIFSKEALVGMPPMMFIGVRFALASSVLCIAGRQQWSGLTSRDYRAAAIVGLLFTVAMMLWITGLQRATHIGEGAFITSLSSVLVPMIALSLFGQAQPRIIWLALPVAVAGFALLALGHAGSGVGFQLEAAQLYFLAAALALALQMIFNSRAVQHMPALLLTAIQLMVVGVCTSLVSIFTEQWPAVISLEVAGWFIASTFIATSFRFFIQTYAMSLAPVSHAAMILTLEPVWTALLAAAWLGESMSPLQLLGCSLIFLALMINRWRWLVVLVRSAGQQRPRL
ncbi:MAG: DMT family transporter [Gammaproteobacteria bacterium]|nr:DMT family transporter [Gammaproteobacteria bacterium]